LRVFVDVKIRFRFLTAAGCTRGRGYGTVSPNATRRKEGGGEPK